MQIDFLTLHDILRIHHRLINIHGGDEGIRDEGLLLSALAIPPAGFFGKYAHNDIYEMAAAYLYHIVMNHPFIDGNKRTGAAAAVVFLGMNNIEFLADNTTLAEFTFSVARSEKDKNDTIQFIKDHCKPIK